MEDLLRTLLAERWGLTDARVSPLDGGMNSQTWSVTTSSRRYVGKWVARASADLLAAGAVAARVAAGSGVRTGVPVPAADGSDLVPLADGSLVLLEHVDGTELEGETDEDARLMGGVLASVHRATARRHADGALAWHWVDLDRLADDPAMLDVASEVVRDVERLEGLSHGLCHGDPTPEAFLRDPAGVGLIDWGSVVDGPLLYDVASAVMYLGGATYAPPLLAAYAAAEGPATPDLGHLDLLLRMRWVVQADYFAGRMASGDLTGIADAEDNRRGYDDARRALLGEPG